MGTDETQVLFSVPGIKNKWEYEAVLQWDLNTNTQLRIRERDWTWLIWDGYSNPLGNNQLIIHSEGSFFHPSNQQATRDWTFGFNTLFTYGDVQSREFCFPVDNEPDKVLLPFEFLELFDMSTESLIRQSNPALPGTAVFVMHFLEIDKLFSLMKNDMSMYETDATGLTGSGTDLVVTQVIGITPDCSRLIKTSRRNQAVCMKYNMENALVIDLCSGTATQEGITFSIFDDSFFSEYNGLVYSLLFEASQIVNTNKVNALTNLGITSWNIDELSPGVSLLQCNPPCLECASDDPTRCTRCCPTESNSHLHAEQGVCSDSCATGTALELYETVYKRCTCTSPCEECIDTVNTCTKCLSDDFSNIL